MITSTFEAMANLFDAVLTELGPDAPRPNVAPTEMVPVVVSSADGRAVAPMRWGLLPPWYKTRNGGPLLINARAETIAEKPAFRTAVRERRCLVPADGYYEWHGEKKARTRYLIVPSDGGMMAFAGIWQDWWGEGGQLSTCAIVTRAANATLAPIHERMPVVIAWKDAALWLGEAGRGAAALMDGEPGLALRVAAG